MTDLILLVLGTVVFALGMWTLVCVDRALKQRLAIIEFVYSEFGSGKLIIEYRGTSFGSHLLYLMTFCKPPYLDRLTGVEK